METKQTTEQAQHTPGPSVRFHRDTLNRGVYGLQPIGSRQFRGPTISEVVHFQTCHAAGPYSAINAQVPPGVPVWQYIDPQERAAAARKCAAIAKATGSDVFLAKGQA